MTGEKRLLLALSEVDGRYIAEAAPKALVRKKRVWLRLCALAACLILIVGAVRVTGALFGGAGSGYGAPGPGGGAVAERYDYYLPRLTLAEDAEGLTAERHVTADAAGHSAAVSDRWTLHNSSGGEARVTVAYPVYWNTFDISVTADGLPVEYGRRAGVCAMDYLDDYSAGSVAEKLRSGWYYDRAFAALPALDGTVTVYELSDTWLKREGMDTLTLRFGFGPEEHRMYCFGGERPRVADDFQLACFTQLSVSMSEWGTTRTRETGRMLAALTGDYAGGWALGACELPQSDAPEINPELGSATVERRTTTTGELLRSLSGEFRLGAELDYDNYLRLLFSTFENWSANGKPADYAGQSDDERRLTALEDVLREADHMGVAYITADIAIPAGGSVELEFGYELENIGGFLMEPAGESSVPCSSFTLEISCETGAPENNMGLAGASGAVALDPARDDYYLRLNEAQS